MITMLLLHGFTVPLAGEPVNRTLFRGLSLAAG